MTWRVDKSNWTVPARRLRDGHPDGFTAVVRQDAVCIPCQQGECVHCRHRPDGARFESSDAAMKRLGISDCLCSMQGHPTPVTCGETAHSADGYGSHRCSKPVKGTTLVPFRFGRSDERGETFEAHRCGLHLAMYRRRAERYEAQQAELEQQTLAASRAAEERSVADETASMLNEACDLLGINIKAVALGGGRYGSAERVRIEIDHEAAGALARFLIDRHG